MAHLLKMSLTKELFGTEKCRAVNWVTQITASSAHVTNRVIYLKKKNNYSNLKFSFNNVISSITSCVTKLRNQKLGYFENAPLLPTWDEYHKKEKTLQNGIFLLCLKPGFDWYMFQLHIWFTLNFLLSIRRINSIPKVTSLKTSSSLSSWRTYKTYYMEQQVDAVTITQSQQIL